MKAEITNLPNQTTNGFLKTINGDGTLAVEAVAVEAGNTKLKDYGTWTYTENYDPEYPNYVAEIRNGRSNTSALTYIGMNSVGTPTGTDDNSSHPPASTPLYRRYPSDKRRSLDGAIHGWRSTSTGLYTATSVGNPVSFYWRGIFIITDVVATNTFTKAIFQNSGFVGPAAAIESQINGFGFGKYQAASDNLFVVMSGSSGRTLIDTGLPVAGALFELAIHIPADAHTGIDNFKWYVKDHNTGISASGVESIAFVSTGFCLSTVTWQMFRLSGTNTTSSAMGDQLFISKFE